MDIDPGYIILLGSGETAPQIRTVYHWLFEQLETPIHTAILETPAGFQPNSTDVAAQIEAFIAKRLQNFTPKFSIIAARKKDTNYSPDNPDLAAQLWPANVILTGPGSPTYAAKQLANSLVWHTLQACHRAGASLIFASAGTIACSTHALPVYEIYKVGEDLHWKQGLDFFAPFGLSLVLIPHWNNNDGGDALDTSRCYMGQMRFEKLLEQLPAEQTIVGIDEKTALIINPSNGNCQVMGAGRVVLIRQGERQAFTQGDHLPVTAFGDFRLPEPDDALPAGTWDSVTTGIAQTKEAIQSTPEPSDEVLTLLEARTQARAERNWAKADALRDELISLGWQIKDTPDGPVLEPEISI